MFDRDLLRDIADTFFVPLVSKEHGNKGKNALHATMETATRLYTYVNPASVAGGIMIIAPISGLTLPASSAAQNVTSLEYLGGKMFRSLVVHVRSPLQWAISEEELPDAILLSQSAVVYRFLSGREAFYANKKEFLVPPGEYGEQSWFAVPAFDDLKAALDHYESKLARCSSCPILEKIWFDTGRRFLRQGPESLMRSSLLLFLKSHLRGNVEVRPEQSMDESYPIDIKVTWFNCNRLALIEIKWLGHSKKEDGTLGTVYSESRANEGAHQLTKYLDRNRVQAPTHLARGWLVIYDARRRRPALDASAITRDDLFYYENENITFSPKYHEERHDCERPRRFFLEPVHP